MISVFHINSNHDHLKAIVNPHLAQDFFRISIKTLLSKVELLTLGFGVSSFGDSPNTSNASLCDISSFGFFDIIVGCTISTAGDLRG
jgi:hypothetical protein